MSNARDFSEWAQHMQEEAEREYKQTYRDGDLLPCHVYEQLSDVIGQEQAKKAVSMILYTLFVYKMPSTSLFIGSTGCGKTELFRQIAKHWNTKKNTFCHIFDASQLTAEGWRGSTHLSDYLKKVENSNNYFHRTLIVLDEFDKIFDQKNSDVAYYDVIQDQCLKLFDHDSSLFNSLDPATTSIVCLGAFSSIFENKQRRGHTVGFTADNTKKPGSSIVTTEDLEAFGLKPELIGRFDRIIQMEEPTFATYRLIAEKEKAKLEKKLKKRIILDDNTLDDLTNEAYRAKLGGRFIKHKLFSLIEDYLYENPISAAVIIEPEPYF